LKTFIQKAYNPKYFREKGHKLIDQLADYLIDVQSGNIPVMNWKDPDSQYKFWKDYNYKEKDLKTFMEDLIKLSIHLHHPKYVGHQVSAPLPVVALTDMVTSLLNNGMAIYEMGPAASALEKWIVKQFSQRFGYGEQGDGILTSGGTLATLTALLAARQLKGGGNVWSDGTKKKLAIMVPAQAHYSIDRAAHIMGFGEDGIIKVPVNKQYQLQFEKLAEYLQLAESNGKKVIAICANACSTATGTYDNLVEIGEFCKQNSIWFHVDAAHGGGAIFTDKYKSLLTGVEKADSVIIDLHKMMMTPALATIVLFKKSRDSYSTFNQDAHYLWEKNEDPDWFNYAKRTFECTKLMMSVKFYSIIVEYGWEIFNENVTTLYDLAFSFAEMVKNRPGFELAVAPMANIVCFRLLSKNSRETNNQLNLRIRRTLLEKGDFYFVQTELNGQLYLRVTLMNPLTTINHLNELLNSIIETGENQQS